MYTQPTIWHDLTFTSIVRPSLRTVPTIVYRYHTLPWTWLEAAEMSRTFIPNSKLEKYERERVPVSSVRVAAPTDVAPAASRWWRGSLGSNTCIASRRPACLDRFRFFINSYDHYNAANSIHCSMYANWWWLLLRTVAATAAGVDGGGPCGACRRPPSDWWWRRSARWEHDRTWTERFMTDVRSTMVYCLGEDRKKFRRPIIVRRRLIYRPAVVFVSFRLDWCNCKPRWTWNNMSSSSRRGQQGAAVAAAAGTETVAV